MVSLVIGFTGSSLVVDVTPWDIVIAVDESLLYCPSYMLVSWLDVDGAKSPLYNDV